MPGLWHDGQIESHRRLTDRIHQAGGRICAQIYHAGRNTHSGITGIHNVAPSAICDPSNRELPHALTEEEILDIENKFVQAALRVKKAGFDAVEIHGAHGYLIAQFLSPFSNRRCDHYGGTVENRARFAVEIIRKVKAAVGNDYPVLFRISAEEYMSGGMNVQHAKAIAMLLEAAGADAINCSQSGPATGYNTVPSFYVPNGAFVDQAAEIKKVVHIPVIAVGRINSPALAEEVLASGKADFVAMGRASVADAELPAKTARGDIEDIQTCIGCCQGCLGSTIKGQTLTCLVNPFAGKETEYKLGKCAETVKKIVIIGGGISGLEAAYITAKRGHQVTIFEKNDTLGGQWCTASVPACKGEFTTLVAWQVRQLEKMGVQIYLQTAATKENVLSENPDIVLDASGSHPFFFPINGMPVDAEPTFAAEILLGKKAFGRHPLIIGGGMAGAETAEFIAGYGIPVTLVETRPDIAIDSEPGPRHFLMKALENLKVDVYTSASVKCVRGETVILEKEGHEMEIPGIDQIIYAVGMRSNTEVGKMLSDINVEIIKIGDAAKVKNGFANVQEAFLTAWDL